MDDTTLKILEQQTDRLVSACEKLKQDNSQLRHERDQLRQKTKVASAKIKSLIRRLQTLENPR